MSRQITLNVSGGMISLIPKDGEVTTIDIYTEDGVSRVTDLTTASVDQDLYDYQEDLNDDEKHSVGDSQVKSNNEKQQEFEQLKLFEEAEDGEYDYMDFDELSPESKATLKPLDLRDVVTDDEEEDVVQSMTSDVANKPATNYKDADYTKDLVDNIPSSFELEDDEPYHIPDLSDDEFNDEDKNVEEKGAKPVKLESSINDFLDREHSMKNNELERVEEQETEQDNHDDMNDTEDHSSDEDFESDSDVLNEEQQESNEDNEENTENHHQPTDEEDIASFNRYSNPYGSNEVEDEVDEEEEPGDEYHNNF